MSVRNRIFVGFLVAILPIDAFAQDPVVAKLRHGLIGYWPLDGDYSDDSGKARQLVPFNSPQFVSDGGRNVLKFENPRPSPQHAIRPDNDPDFNFDTRPFSIQIWVRFANLDREQILIEKFDGPGGWTLTKLNGTHRIRFDSASIGITSGEGPGVAPFNSLTSDQWYHVVVVRRVVSPGSHETKMFLNGVLVGHRMAYSDRNRVPDTTKHLAIGHRFNQPKWGLNGTVKEVALWNRGLSDDEVNGLYNNGKSMSLK